MIPEPRWSPSHQVASTAEEGGRAMLLIAGPWKWERPASFRCGAFHCCRCWFSARVALHHSGRASLPGR